MNNPIDSTRAFYSDFLDWLTPFFDYLPHVLGGLGLLLLGWLVARLLSAGAVGFVTLLEQTILKLFRRVSSGTSVPPTWGRALGSIVFWTTILFFLALATHVLG